MMIFVLIEQRLVERMIIEKQCDPDTAAVVRCLYEQEVHQVSRRRLLNQAKKAFNIIDLRI